MAYSRIYTLLFLVFILNQQIGFGQHSVAREWNEVLLQSIREDFARPTVHARNLFHTSVVMYDAWAVYDTVARPYFLGNTVNGFTCPFNGEVKTDDIRAAQEEAMSYAAYRMLRHRFSDVPDPNKTLGRIDSLMDHLGYDRNNITIDYTSGPAGLGNYLAQFMINYGQQDGSNELGVYENEYYEPVNDNLIMALPGNPDLSHPNRWQPLTLKIFIDQSGNPIPINTPPFLSPEWGKVAPFSLQTEDLDIHERDSGLYYVYHDPGDPPYLDTNNKTTVSDQYKWGFELVSIWSSHLDPADTVRWDISPASLGNIDEFPDSFDDFPNFYKLVEGGDISQGRSVNPRTGFPYQPQKVKRADYARILAEFWADGPDSETPPGHWFTILNYVNDHPLLEKRFKGEGPVLDDLEWDVKSYFLMGGAMHDAAITAWGIKGWYDYIRPVSALRYMADLGQSTDSMKPHYHPGGLRLKTGYIELVMPGDPLAGSMNQHVGKIKIKAWKGPDYISDPVLDIAGVDWILAENWWPYQRPSFVTPPFAGYVSGHSTYSRAAAEVMTMFTGDEYFPGGIGEFYAPKDNFLVFERGPSENVTLQWATYRDASDQCSLSRIWGGIHPPADDIPGRKIGEVLGQEAFTFGEKYFYPDYTDVEELGIKSRLTFYPNPTSDQITIESTDKEKLTVKIYSFTGELITTEVLDFSGQNSSIVDLSYLPKGSYILSFEGDKQSFNRQLIKM